MPFLAQAGTEGAKAATAPPSPSQWVAEGSLTPGCWPMTHEEECAGPFWILCSQAETQVERRSFLPLGTVFM